MYRISTFASFTLDCMLLSASFTNMVNDHLYWCWGRAILYTDHCKNNRFVSNTNIFG